MTFQNIFKVPAADDVFSDIKVSAANCNFVADNAFFSNMVIIAVSVIYFRFISNKFANYRLGTIAAFVGYEIFKTYPVKIPAFLFIVFFGTNRLKTVGTDKMLDMEIFPFNFYPAINYFFEAVSTGCSLNSCRGKKSNEYD